MVTRRLMDGHASAEVERSRRRHAASSQWRCQPQT